ncbi:MAG: isocitrate/isopropylmalate dehydrogenase family protein [Deltaproteobacteria bacterium]|nr:isocitrate/isopropylmalate dehydrogenase family protein [Deltaproteobacteria bacterium]
MAREVVLLPGDGIGPEVCAAARRAVDATGVGVRWVLFEAGVESAARQGSTLPDDAVNAVRQAGAALKGPMGALAGGATPPTVELRRRLDLHAAVRPVLSLPGVATRYEDVDLVFVRDTSEGQYTGLEHRVTPGMAQSIKVTTDLASMRLARFAFSLARSQGRRRVTVAHKAALLKLTDGLFLECVRHVARSFPELLLEEMDADTLCLQLVRDPTRHDVILAQNLHGRMLAHLGAGLVGGAGVVPGANVGDGCAVFEPLHGTAPDLAGRGVANPTAMMRCAVLLLRHLGERDAAEKLDTALLSVLRAGRVRTPDVGGHATTQEFTDAVVAVIGAG